MQLKDRAAVVTSAGEGIGAAVAAAYARGIARVAAVDMIPEAGKMLPLDSSLQVGGALPWLARWRSKSWSLPRR